VAAATADGEAETAGDAAGLAAAAAAGDGDAAATGDGAAAGEAAGEAAGLAGAAAGFVGAAAALVGAVVGEADGAEQAARTPAADALTAPTRNARREYARRATPSSVITLSFLSLLDSTRFYSALPATANNVP